MDVIDLGKKAFFVVHLSTLFICLITVVCAFAILVAGRFLIIFADAFGIKTKIGHALIGSFFLALITSLPEIVATVTAMGLGNASLAVNNLLGGVLMQTFILALADAFGAKKPITARRFPAIVPVMGLFLVVQLGVAAVGFSVGEFVVFRGFGIWPLLLALLYLAIFVVIHKMPGYSDELKFTPRGERQKKWALSCNNWLFGSCFLFFAAVVLIAGAIVTAGIDELSLRFHINAGFLGATVLALITSLPEISTTFYAVRAGGTTLAFTNIFGSNALMLALVFLADMLSPTSVVNQLKTQPVILSGLAIIATVCYVLGMVVKSSRKWLGMGIDSFFVVLTTIAGFVLVYFFA